MGKQVEKMKYRGITIRERVNGSGNISYRVECPLKWFNRPAFRQFKTKKEAKIFIDEQFDEQDKHGKLANILDSEERLDATLEKP
jgi:hypothetical protein